MCLGIPMRIVKNNGITGIAELGGLQREIGLQLLENVMVGDYVIVHAGYAIQKLDEEEAAETIVLLKVIGNQTSNIKNQNDIPKSKN